MGVGHGHGHGAGHDIDPAHAAHRRAPRPGRGGRRARRPDAGFDVAPGPRRVLLGVLALALIATLVGLVTLWPDGDRVREIRGQTSFAAPGVTYPSGEVRSASKDALRVRVVDGPDAGTVVTVDVPPEVARSGLGRGDAVRLIATPGQDGQPDRFSYFGTERGSTLWLLLALFAVVVIGVARWRGLLAIGGLALGGAVIWWFMLPALLVGESGVLVGLTGSAAIMLVVLYTTHGVSMRSSAALAGTLAGLSVTAALALVAIGATHLTGISDESGGILASYAGDLSFQGLLACAMIVAGLGVLNDVTITQASAVWELRGASAAMSRTALFRSGMRIGRDHIASTIYTIAFAYAGAALTVLLVIQLYSPPLAELLTTEEIAQEIVRTLVSSVGLVLAVPLTTLVAVLTVPGPRGTDAAEQPQTAA